MIPIAPLVEERERYGEGYVNDMQTIVLHTYKEANWEYIHIHMMIGDNSIESYSASIYI